MKTIYFLFSLFVIALAMNKPLNHGAKDESVPFGIEFLEEYFPSNYTRICATEIVYRWKKEMRKIRGEKIEQKTGVAACFESSCDEFSYRNAYSNAAQASINIIVNVLCSSQGSCNGVTQASVDAQMKQIHDDFSKHTKVNFVLSQTRFHVDSTYAVLPASESAWFRDVTALKKKYAINWTTHLNIFVTGMKSGGGGEILGVGTFPWDPEAKLNVGGLWVNSKYFGAGQKTASHELGHNVGLYHTFDDERSRTCKTCTETVHTNLTDTAPANNVGDFCADTVAQPENYECKTPTGNDCAGTRWNSIPASEIPALTNNFMAYIPDSCMTTFTRQQSMKASCSICSYLYDYLPNKKC